MAAVEELPTYSALTPGETEEFRRQLEFVAATYPKAGVIGGSALRARLDDLGMPLPRSHTGDIDLLVHDSDHPQEGYYTVAIDQSYQSQTFQKQKERRES